MLNKVADNELRQRRRRVPAEVPVWDRELLEGFWECYPGGVAQEARLAARLVQAVLQAEHQRERRRRRQTDAVEVEVTDQFIRTAMDRAAP
jgi:hypothetical protein